MPDFLFKTIAITHQTKGSKMSLHTIAHCYCRLMLFEQELPLRSAAKYTKIKAFDQSQREYLPVGSNVNLAEERRKCALSLCNQAQSPGGRHIGYFLFHRITCSSGLGSFCCGFAGMISFHYVDKLR
ncbi:hypothetical protein CHARACLAT_022765 [Characodon lateralis]|uniref:Uncharacterized protein n=1 Tax=Characodon lateralis TaxID=208331 RepID=A0ABU7D2V3_9TELE|nr:hypothetical protein [Characodon lateralis]